MSGLHSERRGAGGCTQPGNKKDRDRFDRLTDSQREQVAEISGWLYDGTRTVARCWTEALNEVASR